MRSGSPCRALKWEMPTEIMVNIISQYRVIWMAARRASAQGWCRPVDLASISESEVPWRAHGVRMFMPFSNWLLKLWFILPVLIIFLEIQGFLNNSIINMVFLSIYQHMYNVFHLIPATIKIKPLLYQMYPSTLREGVYIRYSIYLFLFGFYVTIISLASAIEFFSSFRVASAVVRENARKLLVSPIFGILVGFVLCSYVFYITFIGTWESVIPFGYLFGGLIFSRSGIELLLDVMQAALFPISFWVELVVAFSIIAHTLEFVITVLMRRYLGPTS